MSLLFNKVVTMLKSILYTSNYTASAQVFFIVIVKQKAFKTKLYRVKILLSLTFVGVLPLYSRK